MLLLNFYKKVKFELGGKINLHSYCIDWDFKKLATIGEEKMGNPNDKFDHTDSIFFISV